jgi:hypothetical protein
VGKDELRPVDGEDFGNGENDRQLEAMESESIDTCGEAFISLAVVDDSQEVSDTSS